MKKYLLFFLLTIFISTLSQTTKTYNINGFTRFMSQL